MNQPLNYHLGLIGYPLGHSLSPGIHQAALKALGLSGEYQLYPIPPGDEGREPLQSLLTRLRHGEIQGLNVTIPHKETVFPLLDQLTSTAKSIGAVNTLFVKDDQLWGDNTDAPGFLQDLDRKFNLEKGKNKKALIFGSGGAARAVVYALLTKGYQITIAVRHADIEQAQELKAQFTSQSDQIIITNLDQTMQIPEPCSLIVNCTPLGMHPHTETSPWPDGVSFPEGAVLYDLVYNPQQTLLTQQAQTAGLNAVTGLGMLVSQAALAFERWTGQDAPWEVMRGAVSGLADSS